MEPQQDLEATKQAQAFNAKIEEVVGNLGVAIATIAVEAQAQPPDPQLATVRTAWDRLGRSFAELMDMEPPR